jgi:multiple sugar transport system substrate-binding protein
MQGMNTPLTRRRALLVNATVAAPAAAIALAGCGSQPAAAPQTLPPATIEYAYNSGSGALAEARAALVDKFMAAVPNIKVNQQPGQPEAIVLEKFKASSAAGTAPDVVSLNTNVTGDLVASRMLAPLDELIRSRGQGFSRDAFYPDVLGAQTVGGKLYGVPRFVQTMLLYYNRDLFEKAGAPLPTENWTWEKDYLDAAARLAPAMSPGLPAAQGFVLANSVEIRNSNVFSWGGEFFDKAGKKSLLEDAKSLAGLEFTHALRFRHRCPACGSRSRGRRAEPRSRTGGWR